MGAAPIRACHRRALRHPVPQAPERAFIVDGVHPGVARSLGRLVVLSEGRTPSHPDAAELRPCHPDRVTPTALRERCRSHKELCLEVLAVGHKVGHKDKHLRRQWR